MIIRAHEGAHVFIIIYYKEQLYRTPQSCGQLP